jgi:hypothetical protein
MFKKLQFFLSDFNLGLRFYPFALIELKLDHLLFSVCYDQFVSSNKHGIS